MIAKNRPDPRLVLDPRALGLTELPRAFYRRGTVGVARSLVGAWLARRYRGRWYGARIVETEAYLGARRSGRALVGRPAHARAWSRCTRTAGTCTCSWSTACTAAPTSSRGAQGVPEAVLLRAAEGGSLAPERLLSGPGKLCAALGITTADSGADLLGEGALRVLRAPGRRPRLGVSRAHRGGLRGRRRRVAAAVLRPGFAAVSAGGDGPDRLSGAAAAAGRGRAPSS